MKKISKVYISGLGAVGATYGSRILDTEPGSLKVIADSSRVKRYMENGIIINGKSYPFRFVTPGEGGEKADLILIAVKHHQLEQSVSDIEQYVGDETVILSLLNGIVSEETVGRRYGMDKILHSFVVGTDAVREGTEIMFRNTGRIVFGAKDKSKSAEDKVRAVREYFDRAGIACEIPEDIMRELWWKFMFNVGINQVSAVLKAPYGVFRKFSEARELMVMASLEVVAIAEKAGINISGNDINRYIAIMNTLSPEGKTSMLQDIEAGRKTEVEIFSGTVIELGKKYSVQTPVNETLFRMIRTLEQMKGEA